MAPTIGRVALDNGFHGSIPGDWVAPPPQNIQLFGISPFAVTPAVLAITHWLLSIYDTYGIVFLPQMLQGLSFAGQSLIDSFLVKIPVEKLVR